MNKKMKVIFLDIDGVMNSTNFIHKQYKRRFLKRKFNLYISKIKWILNGFKYKQAKCKMSKNYGSFKFTFKRLKRDTDPVKWKWLSEFCNKNDYKICISSCWKTHFKNINDWSIALEKLGFKMDTFVGITGVRKMLRGQEIKEFVEKNNIEDYVILDDDSDMLLEQLNSNFFQVDGYYGISPNHLYRIKRYFDRNLKER